MATNEEQHGQAISADGSPTHEKSVAVQHVDSLDVVQATHVDGTVDLVDRRAIGGELDEMPHGYWHSGQFIGTVAVRECTMLVAVSTLTISTGHRLWKHGFPDGLGHAGKHTVRPSCLLLMREQPLTRLVRL